MAHKYDTTLTHNIIFKHPVLHFWISTAFLIVYTFLNFSTWHLGFVKFVMLLAKVWKNLGDVFSLNLYSRIMHFT